jgi:hypothetical protein
MLKMGLSADIGKQVSQTSLTQQIDVHLKRLTEPRNTDDFSSRSYGIDCLSDGCDAGHSLFWTTARAFKYDIDSDTIRQVFDRFDNIAFFRIERVICSELARDIAGFFSDIDGNDLARAADSSDLQTLKAHTSLSEDYN